MRILLLCNKSPWPPKDGGAAATFDMIIEVYWLAMSSVTVLALNTIKHLHEVEEIPEELRKSTDYHLVNINSKINPVKTFPQPFFSRKTL